MNVLIDSDVILDVLYKREKFYEDSASVMKYCEIKKITGYVSALTVSNIVYIMHRQLDSEKIKEITDRLRLILIVADFRGDDFRKAFTPDFADFGDALQDACAVRVKADYIVTRKVKNYASGSVRAVTPKELLKLIKI